MRTMTSPPTHSPPGLKLLPHQSADEGPKEDSWWGLNEKEEGLSVGVSKPFKTCDTSSSTDDSDGSESSSLSSFSYTFEDLRDEGEGEQETSSDTDEERAKRPHLDEDLAIDWYEGPLFTRRDQRQCNEYFLRGRSLIHCFEHLQDGHALESRHSRRLTRTLYAGKHNCLEHRTKHSDYVRRAQAEYEALLMILHRRDKTLMKHYVVAALVAVQNFHLLVFQAKLMEVALMMLREEDTCVEDLHTLLGLCHQVEYGILWQYLQRPLGEVLVGVVHSLLYRMKLKDLHAVLHHQHKSIYQLACAPVFGILGYHCDQPRPDTAILFNNSAKIFHDYLGDEAHLLLLLALHTSLLSPELGQLSDLLLDRVARAANICTAPSNLLARLERHLHVTDSHPGPQGCVALLRLLRRCHLQVGQLQDLPALLQRLVALLVVDNDRPMTTARDLGRLLLFLRTERPELLQATVESGKVAIKNHQGWGVDMDVSVAAAQHFLVNLVRLVVGAARAVPLPPVTHSDSDWDSEWDSEGHDEPEILPPVCEEVAATLLGLCGRQAEPRASWSGLASEVSHLMLPQDSGPDDCLLVDAVLHLATRLQNDDDSSSCEGQPRDGDDDQASEDNKTGNTNMGLQTTQQQQQYTV